MDKNRFSLESHVDLSKIESGVGMPANALTPEEYEKAWKEIVGDYPAFFEAVEKIVPLIDEHGVRRSAYDIFQDIAKHVYENPIIRCRECKYAPKGTGGFDLEWPYMNDEGYDTNPCPLKCSDPWYSKKPKPDFFCAYGEKKED